MRKEKLERYRAVVREQRDFLESGVPERLRSDPNFDFLKDDAYQKREAEISALSQWLQADAALDERERAFDHDVQTRNDRRGSDRPDELTPEQRTERENEAFVQYLATGDRSLIRSNPRFEMLQRASMATTSGSVGGYTVPTAVASQIIQDLPALETVRMAGAQVIQIAGNQNIPTMAHPTAAYVAEAGTITDSDPTTGVVSLTPNMLVVSTTYTLQLENRSAADIVAEIRKAFAIAIAEKEDSKFLVGSGTNEPAGVAYGGTLGVTTASTTTFTAAEIISLWYSLDVRYMNQSSWIMRPEAAAILRGLAASGSGDLVWSPGLADGVQRLFGRPVYLNAYMDAVTAAKKPVIVGDIYSAYVIGEEVTMQILVDPYTQASTGKKKIYMYLFNDGRVKKSAAVRYMITAAV